MGITNRVDSSLGRELDNVIDIGSGIEIGVAATKTFLGRFPMSSFSFYLRLFFSVFIPITFITTIPSEVFLGIASIRNFQKKNY